MHEGEIIFRSDFREPCWGSGIGCPGTLAIYFGAIDNVIRRAIDNRIVLAPRTRGSDLVGCDIEFLSGSKLHVRSILINFAQSTPQLAIRTGDEDLPR